MTDKELIKQEIERRISNLEQLGCRKYIEKYFEEQFRFIEIYESLIKFIDSLPEEPAVKGITWEDVNTLDTLINQVRYEFPNGIGEKSFGLAVLEKFQDYQDDIEEPASEDLEEAAKEYVKENCILPEDCNDGEIPYYEECTAVAFKAGAEWQKRKSMQDFLEKACEWLKESITNNPECNRIISKKGVITMGLLIEDFKNYMQDESEN